MENKTGRGTPRDSPAEKRPLEQDLDREPVFYYSRSSRLERASPRVRALNEEGPGRRPSLVGSLTATRPLAILFFTIVVFMIFGFVLSLVSGKEGECRIGGNFLSLAAMGFEGNTILAVKKTIKGGGEAYTGGVDLAVSPVMAGAGEGAEYPVWSHRIFFTLRAEEDYRLAVPFEAAELLVLLRTETEQTLVKVKPR